MPIPTHDAFQVIGDPSRRKMLMLLSGDSLTINSLAENFDMSRPAVSKHIKILQEAGFISIQDIGRERYCTLKKEGFEELQDWISYFDTFWTSKLKKLEILFILRRLILILIYNPFSLFYEPQFPSTRFIALHSEYILKMITCIEGPLVS